MSIQYYNLPLEITTTDSFELERARTSLKAVQNSPYCSMVSMGKVHVNKDIFNRDDEVLIFDTEVEVPQYPKNDIDIRKNERIAIIFNIEDKFVPWVFALRNDFPEVIHENSFFNGYPKSLCIYEKSFDEIKISWSSAVFIEDIRNWLKLTAKGKLHQEDQQLERFVLFDEGEIILPYDIKPNEKLYAYVINQRYKRVSVLTARQPINASINVDLNLKIVFLSGNSQTHGVIKYTPRNFEDLNIFLLKAELDFKSELVKILRDGKNDSKKKLLFLINLPKKRNNFSAETESEIHAYITINNIQEIGVKIGLWELFDKELVEIYNFNFDSSKSKLNIEDSCLQEINIGLLKPHYSFNSTLASLLNNSLLPSLTPNILAIGLGSLGSQIFINLTRSGWGKWNLVDDDILLPHNLARHSLYSNFVLSSKVKALSSLANDMLSDNTFSVPLFTNILRQQNVEEEKLLEEKIKQCDTVFDFSATISVPRHLCNNHRFSYKRILSSFLNPSGLYSVILYEDKEKILSIDIIEMLFYRELITNNILQNYFTYNDGGNIRYSTSCRDTSNRISQDYLALHSAIISDFIKKNFQNANARALVIQYNNEELSVTKHEVVIPKIFRYKLSEWEIIVDDSLINKIYKLRVSKLPNETGGILVGSWDVEYKRIYILDTIIPVDNSEYPSFFFRGIEGLKESLQRINKLTAGTIKYVGEWHSHPDNCLTEPSCDDLKLLGWLTENMSFENLPAIMLIIGENKEYSFCLGKISE